MNKKQDNIKLRYQGYLNTFPLWDTLPLLGLKQIQLDEFIKTVYKQVNDKKYRLGHLVEQFVFHDLEQRSDVSLLSKNVQIKREKQTIGELDCILKKGNEVIHLEIIYKFYLYDESVGYSELEHWIGPNRKDSFIEKITKLKNKQLPLLYKPETQILLDELNLKTSNIEQQVLFKAQLFVPYLLLKTPLRFVNNNCILGYYINFKDIDTIRTNQFYIPQKLDWLSQPHIEVDWLNFDEAQQIILNFISQEKSPLCWIKSSDGTLQKLFIVWW